MMDYLKFHNKRYLCVTWTSIAANLLENGRTVHTTCKLHFHITDQTVCNIKANSKNGHIMKVLGAGSTIVANSCVCMCKERRAQLGDMWVLCAEIKGE